MKSYKEFIKEEIGFGGVASFRSPWTNRTSRSRRSNGGDDNTSDYTPKKQDPNRYFRDVLIEDEMVSFKHYPRNKFNIPFTTLGKTKEELEALSDDDLKTLLKSNDKEWNWDTSDMEEYHDSYDVITFPHNERKILVVGTIQEATDEVRRLMKEGYHKSWSNINTYNSLAHSGSMEVTHGSKSLAWITKEGYFADLEKELKEKELAKKKEVEDKKPKGFWDFLKRNK